ncbi:MAG: DUF3048 C-terminal domain-containing protein [Clostridia bacterium]|nr:DUF3048 C-terminal domain-containing protein [Clostridia bacterium]
MKRRLSGLFAILISTILSLSLTTGCARQSLAQNQEEPPSAPTVNTPVDNTIKYYNYLTGLETSESCYVLRPVSFCVENQSGSVRGISSAQMVIEAPCDNFKTKFCILGTEYDIFDSVGTITHMPSYLSGFVSAFNAIQIYNGTDSVEAFNSFNATSGEASVFFRESETGQNLLMASGKNVSAAAKSSGYQIMQSATFIPPFSFSDSSSTANGAAANYLTLPYYDSLTVSFTYNSQTGKYVRSENGTVYKDADGQNLSYSNVFVLFADTTTTSTHQGTTVKLDTASGGDGYFASGGRYTSISWSRDQNGNLVVTDSSGNSAIASRGAAYIGILPVGNASKMIIGN